MQGEKQTMKSQKCRNCGETLLSDGDLRRKSEGKPVNFEYLDECDFCCSQENKEEDRGLLV